MRFQEWIEEGRWWLVTYKQDAIFANTITQVPPWAFPRWYREKYGESKCVVVLFALEIAEADAKKYALTF